MNSMENTNTESRETNPWGKVWEEFEKESVADMVKIYCKYLWNYQIMNKEKYIRKSVKGKYKGEII